MYIAAYATNAKLINLINSSTLKAVWPEKRKTDAAGSIRRLFLAVGSSMDVLFRGGPYPRFGEPLDHFIKG